MLFGGCSSSFVSFGVSLCVVRGLVFVLFVCVVVGALFWCCLLVVVRVVVRCLLLFVVFVVFVWCSPGGVVCVLLLVVDGDWC